MLDGIFQVLTTIGDFFSSVGSFLVSFIQDLVGFVTQIGTVGGQVTSILGGLPAYFVTGILSLIAVMVLLRVLGRD